MTQAFAFLSYEEWSHDPMSHLGSHMTPCHMTPCHMTPCPYLVMQFLQLLLQLGEVARGDEGLLRLVQAVSDQLGQLVLDEAQHPVPQREGAVRGAEGDDVQQALLHLRCGLEGTQYTHACYRPGFRGRGVLLGNHRL